MRRVVECVDLTTRASSTVAGMKRHVLLRPCIGAFALDTCSELGSALLLFMDQYTPRHDTPAKPLKPARVALNVLALWFCAVGGSAVGSARALRFSSSDLDIWLGRAEVVPSVPIR